MQQPEAFDGKLPPPRDDEPLSLRQDIIDEHQIDLHCSFERELLIMSDTNQASQNALSRFGPPNLVARQLWSIQ